MDKLMPALQTYSILAAAMAAGANLSTSIITFPALRHAPDQLLLTQWQTLYDSGLVPVVTTALSSAAGFAALAYRTSLAPAGTVSTSQRNWYAAAAVAMLGLAPYTRIVMGGTIDELSRRAKARKEESEKADTRALVEQWGTLNLWRGMLLLMGTGVGVWASVAA
ncbi:DUF1772-domain-containing protein [Lentithecium fluviatile CBS 122367]|uniref:DUF1772-domain-containing protein n=1 Tax=Lentithecium fluviatile CBS 122367 TaxID=1168545 RepID=A0A6G1IMS5_9PLEO|nr:DUF1772-domain-containing protein [Lentithecium fluviatile CBS 122367]